MCFSRGDAVPEVSPAHGAEAHPGRLRLQSGVHLVECGGGEHPPRQAGGCEEGSRDVDQEEQRDSSDQPRVQHQETPHRRSGRGRLLRAASICVLAVSLQPLTHPHQPVWTEPEEKDLGPALT